MSKILRCKKCGIEINGGCYNTPRGVYCCKCWEAKPERVREKAFKEAIKNLSAVGSIYYNLK